MRTLNPNLRGAVYMVLGNAGYAFNDCFIKLIAASISLEQLVFMRGIAVTMLFLIFALHEKAYIYQYRRRDMILLGLRSLSEVALTIFFLSALVQMPIFLLTAILQSAPLMVTIAAVVFFREPVGIRRWSATVIGFFGVLLIIQPGPEGISESAFLGLMATVFIVTRDCITRMLSADVPTSMTGLASSLFLTTAAGAALVLLPESLTSWLPLAEFGEWDLLTAAILCLFLAYIFSILAMRVGDIGFVSPFRYTGMIWVALTGYYVFNDPFDPIVLLGVTIVTLSSAYTLMRERQVQEGGSN